MQSKHIIDALENPEAKQFIIRHIHDDINVLALQDKGQHSFDLRICLQLIGLYKKARSKLPHLSSKFPALTDRSLQQATSERVASYKASLMQGTRMLDLTGGLGIDDLAFADQFEEVVSVDVDEELNHMARYNARLMGKENLIRIDGKAEEMSWDGYDVIYVDPDRREGGQRVIDLDGMKPNLPALLRNIERFDGQVFIKLSPVFDLTEAKRQLPHIQRLIGISEGNEVKELLVELHRGRSDITLKAINLGQRDFEFQNVYGGHAIPQIESSERFDFVMLPLKVLNKMELASSYMNGKAQAKHKEFEIYFASEAADWPGCRTFKIEDRISASPKAMKKYCKDKGVKKATLIIKGSREQASTKLKKMGIKEGEDAFFLLLLGKEKECLVLNPWP